MKTTSDLRDVLFGTINDVREGKLDTDRAKSIVDIAQTIVNTAKVEVDFIRATDQYIDTGFIKNQPEEIPDGVTGIVRNRLM